MAARHMEVFPDAVHLLALPAGSGTTGGNPATRA
jgi:hypothetical protein